LEDEVDSPTYIAFPHYYNFRVLPHRQEPILLSMFPFPLPNIFIARFSLARLFKLSAISYIVYLLLISIVLLDLGAFTVIKYNI